MFQESHLFLDFHRVKFEGVCRDIKATMRADTVFLALGSWAWLRKLFFTVVL